MNNVSDTLLKSSKQSLKRFILIFLVILGISMVWFVPRIMEWIEKSQKVEIMTSEIATQEAMLKKLEAEVANIKTVYDDKKISANIDQSLFPETVSHHQVARVLELFALQMQNNLEIPFQIERLNFSKSTQKKGENFARNNVDLSLKTNDAGIRIFTEFLQTNRIPEEIAKKGFENKIKNYIEKNKIGMTHIQSVSINYESKDESSDAIGVNIAFTIFSQK